MNKNDNLHILFKTLADILPYEYGEHLNENTGYIEITKEDSTIVAFVTEDETEPGTLDATFYDTEDDTFPPYGTASFDTTDPDFNILDAVNEIKQFF